ncbi:hypothetical protein P8A11_14980, partial [Staphylococcus aureus]|nr:hypothetical protein [Staphylococcus aureus]
RRKNATNPFITRIISVFIKSSYFYIVSRQEETRFQLVSKPFKFLKSQKSIPRESQEKYKAFI